MIMKKLKIYSKISTEVVIHTAAVSNSERADAASSKLVYDLM
jgi:hypothetical protein